MPVDGSYAIHNYINTFTHPAEMYTWFGVGHVPFSGSSVSNIAYMDTTVRFVSNFLYKYFGCTPADPNPVQNTFATVGIADNFKVDGIRLGKNPVDETIDLYLNKEESLNISILNSAGQMVYQADFHVPNLTVNIPVKYLPNGLYFLHFKGVNKSGILKVMVQHD